MPYCSTGSTDDIVIESNMSAVVARSDIIVLGTLTSAKLTDTYAIGTTFSGAPVRLRMVRFSLAVRDVVKGEKRNAKNVDGVFYQWADGAYDGPPRARLVTGESGFFFLTVTEARNRSATDLFQFWLPTQAQRVATSREVEAQSIMAETILKPSNMLRETNANAYANWAIDLAARMIGMKKTITLVGNLLNDSEADVAGFLCVSLSRFIWASGRCLAELGAKGAASNTLTTEIADLKVTRARWDAEETSKLKAGPIEWYTRTIEAWGKEAGMLIVERVVSNNQSSRETLCDAVSARDEGIKSICR